MKAYSMLIERGKGKAKEKVNKKATLKQQLKVLNIRNNATLI